MKLPTDALEAITAHFDAMQRRINTARGDSWLNALTGFGQEGRDVTQSYQPQAVGRVDTSRFSKLGRGNLYAQRLIEELPGHALKKGWMVTGVDADDLATVYRAWDLQEKLREALELARQFGEAYLWFVFDGDDARPLDEAALARRPQLLNIVVLDQREVSPHSIQEDPEQREYGDPEVYAVSAATTSGTHRVHRTRMVRFVGRRLPRTELQDNGGYHDSLLTSAEGPIQRWGVLEQSLAVLVKELKIDVLKMEHAQNKSSNSEADRGESKLQRTTKFKNILNMIVLAATESFERHGVPLSGLKDLVQPLAWSLSAGLRQPLVNIFGIPPAGLSADDAASERNWNERTAEYQTRVLTPALERIHQLLFAASNVDLEAPEGWTIEWPPIDEPTEAERTEQAGQIVEMIEQLVALGVPLREAMEAMIVDGAWQPAAPAWRPDAQGEGSGEQTDVARTAMNGAQVTSMVTVATAAKAGDLHTDSARAILERAFQVQPDVAGRIIPDAPPEGAPPEEPAAVGALAEQMSEALGGQDVERRSQEPGSDLP